MNDLTGQRFGALVVQQYAGKHITTRRICWTCTCDCGKTATVQANNLTTGNTTSCGCKSSRVRLDNPRSRKHGMSNTITYSSWDAMMRRCYLPSKTSYRYYGDRGIEVCERWHKFENFLEDMGERPLSSHCLSRINHDDNYKPGNVVWGLIEENSLEALSRARNKRGTA